MTLRRPALLLLVVLGASLPFAVRGDDEKKKDDKADAKKEEKLGESEWYPLAVGTTWTYDNGHQKLKVKVTEHEKVKEVLCARLETTAPGGVYSEHVSIKEDGIYRHTYNGTRIEPPIRIFKLPYKKGDEWPIKSKQGEIGLSGKFTTDEDDDLDVPAGTFKAVVVKGELEAQGETFKTAVYYVKGKGPVKIEFGEGLSKVTCELRKFKLGTGKAADDEKDDEEKKPEGKKPEKKTGGDADPK